MARRGVWLVLAGLLLSARAVAAPELSIIPRPQREQTLPGVPVVITEGTAVVAGDAEARAVAAYLVDLARRGGGPQLRVAAAPADGVAVRLVRRAGFAPEGYAIDIGAGGVRIAASTRAGLLYGAVGIWQALAAAPGGRLPRTHIEDAPRFAWRALMLDSARHYQSPAEIARMLDWMALHKLNRLQWHLVDDQGWRLEIPRYPRLTSIGAWRTTPSAAGPTPGRYGGFYTAADVRRLVRLAAARNITVVPEIEMPGHATAAILAYPHVGMTTVSAAAMGDWGVFPSIYNPDEPTLSFLENILSDVMAFFPSHEIAIGGDEAVHTLWHQSPAVQARMKTLGLADETALQGWFVRRIGAYLNAHGRRLVGWDEILSDGKLPKGDMVLSWHGAQEARAAARTGHDVVVATAPTLYFDNRQSNAPAEPPGRGTVVSLRDVYTFDPVGTGDGAALSVDEAAHIIGIQGAVWTEHIATDARVEAMAWPRAAALAEIGWTGADRRDWPDFIARLPTEFARARALGLNADEAAIAVNARVTPTEVGARVTLGTQLGLGDIRYTTDGGPARPDSAIYSEPLMLPLPSHLRAASFLGAQPLSGAIDLPLDTVSATHRASQQLKLCTDKVALNLEGKAAVGARAPVYLIDIKNPCWIYRGARLDGVGRLAAGVAALPFNYQLGDEVKDIVLRPPATPAGELIVHLDSCIGPVLLTQPLGQARRDGGQTVLVAPIAPQSGAHDLCVVFTQAALDPMWALGWLELRP